MDKAVQVGCQKPHLRDSRIAEGVRGFTPEFYAASWLSLRAFLSGTSDSTNYSFSSQEKFKTGGVLVYKDSLARSSNKASKASGEQRGLVSKGN